MDEWEPFMQHVSEGHLIFSELTHNSWEMTLHSKLISNILECYQEKIQLYGIPGCMILHFRSHFLW